METYDYIIAGGGCAGLSLAYYLSQSGQAGKKILIIDRSGKEANDRTWCFWADEPTAFQEIVHREWSSLSFREELGVYRSGLGKSRYQMIRGLDFYRYVKRRLAAFPNIRFLKSSIQHIAEDGRGPYVLAGEETYRAGWIFDSTIDHQRWNEIRTGHRFLWQHFRGWIIQTPEPAFDPEDATLMDFRTAQSGSARFLYLLPLNEREALLEYTLFSPDLLSSDDYERALEQYCREKLQLQDYRILERESGKIPMTDAPIIHSKGPHIIPIGTPGGAVKPSTGYAFLRIQQQVKGMVEQLERGFPPSHPQLPAGRFHFYDRLLLHLLLHEGDRAKDVFCHLFRHNPMLRILGFLDERSHWRQEILIFARLPFGPFLRACWALYVKPWLGGGRPKRWMVGQISNIVEK